MFVLACIRYQNNIEINNLGFSWEQSIGSKMVNSSFLPSFIHSLFIIANVMDSLMSAQSFGQISAAFVPNPSW